MCNSPLPFFPMIESSLGNLKIRQSLKTHTITIEIKNSNIWGLDTNQIEVNKNLIHFVDSGEVVGIKVFSEALKMTEDKFRYKPWIFVDTKFNARTILIEDKGSGTSLVQQLRREANDLSIINVSPDKDKVTRMHTASVEIEAGKVYLPEKASW
jgi:hypothetical protein